MRRLIDIFEDSLSGLWIIVPAFVIMVLLSSPEESNVAYNVGVVLGIFLFIFIPTTLLLVFLAQFKYRRVNLVITAALLFLVGLFIAYIVADADPADPESWSPVEAGLILNIGTETIGAAIFLILLRLRRLGAAIGLAIGTLSLSFVNATDPTVVDFFINISGEIFGALLTGWIIYLVLEIHEDKRKNDETEFLDDL